MSERGPEDQEETTPPVETPEETTSSDQETDTSTPDAEEGKAD